jgi:hypothetical protein
VNEALDDQTLVAQPHVIIVGGELCPRMCSCKELEMQLGMMGLDPAPEYHPAGGLSRRCDLSHRP